MCFLKVDYVEFMEMLLDIQKEDDVNEEEEDNY